ncbi:hypothetical protein CEXT_157071 [Caerostris extrusa]|uniref:Uncharacterized protein n=1 Tax=Caerostris extrusa TaxID=172846 RepID=A0AAV4R611_CAEEX|nr:hypothetical protein CEXT_157071 [Caerostris extrusa]
MRRIKSFAPIVYYCSNGCRAFQRRPLPPIRKLILFSRSTNRSVRVDDREGPSSLTSQIQLCCQINVRKIPQIASCGRGKCLLAFGYLLWELHFKIVFWFIGVFQI